MVFIPFKLNHFDCFFYSIFLLLFLLWVYEKAPDIAKIYSMRQNKLLINRLSVTKHVDVMFVFHHRFGDMSPYSISIDLKWIVYYI